MAFEKSILHSGADIYLPNNLATVVVDVVGKWCTSDGDDVVFDQRESVSIELGAFHLEILQFGLPTALLLGGGGTVKSSTPVIRLAAFFLLRSG